MTPVKRNLTHKKFRHKSKRKDYGIANAFPQHAVTLKVINTCVYYAAYTQEENPNGHYFQLC